VKKWNGPKQYTDPTGELMMLPADLALRDDPEFRKYCEKYAKDEQLFFKDFAAAWQKLTEAGWDKGQSSAKSSHRSVLLVGLLTFVSRVL